MPTAPIKEFLYNINSDLQIKEYLSGVSEIFFEMVNYGTVTLQHYDTNKTVAVKNIASLVLYRHGLELINSIGINIKHGSIEAAKILINDLFETMISLQYLYKEDFERRSLAYLFCQIMRELNQLEIESEGFTLSKDTLETIKQYINTDKAESYVDTVIDEKIISIKHGLSQGIFNEVIEEYEYLKNSGNSHPLWYQFFNGPADLKELSVEAGSALYYKMINGTFSCKVLSSDVFNSSISMKNLIQINSPKDTNSIINLASLISSSIIETFYLNEFPDKEDEYSKWHTDEIFPLREKYTYPESRDVN